MPFLGRGPLHIVNINTDKAIDARLYDLWGHLDGDSASALDNLLCDARDRDNIQTTVLDRRTLQLMYRAAYHFRAKKVIVVSAYRKPGAKGEGRHGEGKAIDFKLTNTSASALAAYLRTLSRVGVGVYTHPGTQYVHLDVRDQSYYWNRRISARTQLARATPGRGRDGQARRDVLSQRRLARRLSAPGVVAKRRSRSSSAS